jgi:hypothetical protein
MTQAELEYCRQELAEADLHLAELPAKGRLAQEVAATRAQLAATASLVALTLRQLEVALPELDERDGLLRELAGHGQGRTGDLHRKPTSELRTLRDTAVAAKKGSGT